MGRGEEGNNVNLFAFPIIGRQLREGALPAVNCPNLITGLHIWDPTPCPKVCSDRDGEAKAWRLHALLKIDDYNLGFRSWTGHAVDGVILAVGRIALAL